jgi:hypothetical protein
MDIAALSMAKSSMALQQEVGTALSVKVLDTAKQQAAAILDMLPKQPSSVANMTPHLGQNLNSWG